MNAYKYIILFIALTLCSSNFVRGQYHMEAFVSGISPLTNNAKGYKMGGQTSLLLGYTFNEVHQVFAKPSFIYIPGERTNDKYLDYKQSPIAGFPLQLGYSYEIAKNVFPSLGMGPVFYTKPDTVTGFNLALDIKYRWRKIGIHAGLQRLTHHGHMDLFKFGLSYQFL